MKREFLLSMIFVFMTIISFSQTFGTIGTQWYYSEHAGVYVVKQLGLTVKRQFS